MPRHPRLTLSMLSLPVSKCFSHDVPTEHDPGIDDVTRLVIVLLQYLATGGLAMEVQRKPNKLNVSIYSSIYF